MRLFSSLSSALIAATVLSGCAAKTASDFTTSGFATVAATSTGAEISNSSLTRRTSGSDTNAAGDGYAYEVGVDGSNGFVARSGMLSTTSVAALPSTGTATMSGTYEVARVTGISLSGSLLTGSAVSASGALTLTADFAGQTLTGISDNGLLAVNGTFNSQDLNGSVTYRGIPGQLDGLVGGDQAVGVFHGQTSTAIMAGGFMVD